MGIMPAIDFADTMNSLYSKARRRRVKKKQGFIKEPGEKFQKINNKCPEETK